MPITDTTKEFLRSNEAETIFKQPERSQWQLAWIQVRRNRLATLGMMIILLAIAVAVLSPVLAPANPTKQNMTSKLVAPSLGHPLGTDAFGRDVLSRMMYGSRTSLFVGLVTVLVAIAAGVPLGLVSGFIGGRFDNVVMRIMDAFLSFPAIMLALALMGILGPDIQNVILALGVVYMPTFARLARASTLSVKEEKYITAARNVGVSTPKILFAHILPNIIAPLVVQATFNFSSAIVAAATLSFLGLGVQPPTPDWGFDLSEGRRYVRLAPWLTLAPTIAISITVLGINFFGDGLRDALDPRYRSESK
jgi:peptide/nickel transport system permease protein